MVEQRAREGEILAPATGRVLTVPVTPGSVILPGEEIARIATGPYYLRLSLPERHASEIKEGDTVLVGERSLSRDVERAVADAGRARSPRSIRRSTTAASSPMSRSTDVGDYFVNERTLVSIPVGKRSALLVPPQSVKTLHGVDYVRIAGAQGEIDVAVILGRGHRDGDGPRIEILSGLRDGDKVVLP